MTTETVAAPEAAQEQTATPEVALSELLTAGTEAPVEQETNTPADNSIELKEEQEANKESNEFQLPDGFETTQDLLDAFTAIKEQHSAPEDYEVPTIEGFEFYDDVEFGVGQFKEMAKEMNLNQDSFNKVVDFYVKSEAQRATLEQQSREEAVYEAFGGKDKAIKAIPVTSARVKSVLGDAGMEVYQDAASGSISSAASAIKLAHMLISKFDGEPNMNARVNATPALSRESLREMMRDPRYKSNPEYRAQVDAGYQKLFG